MSTLLFTLGVFLLVALALALGVLAGRKPIQGSCGGISAVSGGDCPVCGGNPAKCDARDAPRGQTGHNAARERR